MEQDELTIFPNSYDWSWQRDAACATVEDPDIFFPPRDKEKYKAVATEAKAYCFGNSERPECPVRTKCLKYAVESDEQHGIWGGLSHRERNALVRKWKREYKGIMTLAEFLNQPVKRGK